MTRNDGFDRTVTDWLDGEAGRGAPGYLDEVLTRTIRTRQRPAWSSLERWLPVDIAYRARVAPVPRLIFALALVAILVLAAAYLLIAGVGQRHLPHFGAAANGNIVFVDGSSLRAAGPDGTISASLGTLPEAAEQLAFSPDGTRLAYRTPSSRTPSLVVLDSDGSHPVVVVFGSDVATGGPIAWSPDSRRIAYTMIANDVGTIEVADADGSHRSRLMVDKPTAPVDRFNPAWSPDGQWISFFSTEANGVVRINLIHPDGSGVRQLDTLPVSPDFAQMFWSPDPGQQRLAYVSGLVVTIYDIATDKKTIVSDGFWPSWSPDGRQIAWWHEGTHVVAVADLQAGRPAPFMPFPAVPGASCRDNPDLAGKAICTAANWSPDGRWISGLDVLLGSIVVGRVDGSSPPHSIPLDHPFATGEYYGLAAWQAVAP